MAALMIITGADQPVLRAKAERIPLVNKEVKRLIKDMRAAVRDAEGLGLAAPQVGQSIRLCLAMLSGRMTALVNPEITWRSAEMDVMEEGCLSIPEIHVNVPRALEILVRYLDESGTEQERRLRELDARVVQHEVDHLNGVLIVDYQS